MAMSQQMYPNVEADLRAQVQVLTVAILTLFNTHPQRDTAVASLRRMFEENSQNLLAQAVPESLVARVDAHQSRLLDGLS